MILVTRYLIYRESESEHSSVMSNSFPPHRLYSPWNSPGQNTGVGSCSLVQGIFPSQGLNPDLPHCRQILHQLSQQGSPIYRELSPDISDASGEVHTSVPSDTHLAVDHTAHGYSQPHPHTLHVVEAQVVQNGPHQHAGAQPRRVGVGFVQSGRIGGILVLNITNHFPEEYGLNYSGAFLKGKKKKKGLN